MTISNIHTAAQTRTANPTHTGLQMTEPVTCIYDMPCFVTDGLIKASDAVNFWTAEHSSDIAAADRTFQQRGPLPAKAQKQVDLGLFRTDHDIAFAENLSTHTMLAEVLEHTVGEVHTLPTDQRGHYLAQLLTRWFSDGTLAWQRFRLAALLATYYSMMPEQQAHLGALETDDIDLTVFGWSTVHGEFLDVVHVFRPMDRFVEEDVQNALALGARRWPGSFLGVRYLPLEGINDARFYRPDGSWDSVIERDLLHLH